MPVRPDSKKQGPTILWLLNLIEEFLTLNEMDNDGRRFGRYAVNNPALVERLRDGYDVSVTTMDDILAFMQNPVTKTEKLKPLTIEPKELP